MFCELGSCAGQPRLLWFVVILHSASNATATRQLVLEVLHREPDRRQRQPFLGNLFVNCCPLAPLVAQLSSGHEEQHDQGELNPLLFDVVFINHGNRVAGRHCVAPLLYFTLSNGAVFCFLGGPARLNGTETSARRAGRAAAGGGRSCVDNDGFLAFVFDGRSQATLCRSFFLRFLP